MRILTIGEAMVELAPSGEAGLYQLGYAGDTFNTAWYLRALRPDIETSFFTRVGADGLSDDFLARMREAGIGTDHVTRVTDRTLGLYLIQLNQGERSFAYWRDTSAARSLADDGTALAVAMAAHDLIYFSGITLAVLGRPSARCSWSSYARRGPGARPSPSIRTCAPGCGAARMR